MKYMIQHEIRGRMRVHLAQSKMTCQEADTLQYFLENTARACQPRPRSMS